MLKRIYLVMCVVLVLGYFTFSIAGYELGGSKRDPVPTAYVPSSSGSYGSGSSSGSGRTGGIFFGGGSRSSGWSFGK